MESNKLTNPEERPAIVNGEIPIPAYSQLLDLAYQTFELTTSPMIYFDGPSFAVMLMNESARKLWKIKPAVYQMPLSALEEPIRNFFEPYLREVYLTGEPIIVKELKSGSQYDVQPLQYFDLEIKTVQVKEGKIGLLATLTDVTESVLTRIEFQKRERKVHQQLQLITDAMPLMIAYIDNQGTIRFANKMFESWIGISSRGAYNKPMQEVFGTKAYAVFEPYSKQVLKGALAEFKCSISLRNQRKVIESHYLPHFNSDKSVAGYYAIICDITDRRQITHSASDNDGKISTMRSSLSDMSETISQISKKLDAAKVKLNRARRENQRINDAMKKWTSDLQVSEAITQKVKNALDEWLSSAA